MPYVGALDEKKTVWTAIAYHGNGVAMASYSGRGAGRSHCGQAGARESARGDDPAAGAVSAAGLRPLYLKGAYLWYRDCQGRSWL